MKKLRIVLFFVLLFLPLSNICSSNQPSIRKIPEKTITVNELLKKQTFWDKKEVVLRGEVIGQPLTSNGKTCLHLLDHDNNAIPVWIKSDLTANIRFFGRYRVLGDTVEIKGTFHLLCVDHPGDTDIHALSMRIIQKGSSLPKEPFSLVLLFISAALLLIVFSYYLTKRKWR